MDFYDVQQVNYDPAMSDRLVEKLENLGLECVQVDQYARVLNSPLKMPSLFMSKGLCLIILYFCMRFKCGCQNGFSRP